MSEIELLCEQAKEQGKFEKEMELAPERINLRNENLILRKRIIKAIEYINSQSPDAGVCGKTIKKILKGIVNE